MRIALITPRYAPAIGGVERVAEMQALELHRRGLQLEVITTDPTRRLPHLEQRAGVLVRRFPTVAGDDVYFLAPALGAWLSRHAREFDVLHAHSYHTPLALQTALAARAAKRPLIVTPHYHGTGHSAVRRWLHRPYRPLGRWLLRQARRVLCVSGVEELLLREHFGESLRTTVVPNGIDVDELSPARRAPRSQPDRGVRVLFVGRLDAYKVSRRLIDAVPYLPSGSRLTLIGDGPLRMDLTHAAETLGIRSRVDVEGWLSRAELIDRYAAAHVFVSLSLHESFGLAVLEAGAAGLPLAVSDIPAHREIADYLGPGRARFIDPGANARTIADAVFGAASLGRAENVGGWPLPTWSKHVDAMLDAYRTSVPGRSAA
jgi:1,2-diacylglycerol 3-alpha-glucosyltransferase